MSEGENTPEKQEAQKSRIVKAKAGGFAQGKAVEPVKKASTEKIAEAFDEKMEKLARMARQSLEDAMAPTQPMKVRVDAANKFLTHMHRPTQQVEVKGDVTNNGVVFNVTNMNHLSPEDRELFERAQRAKGEVIEGEVIEGSDGSD